MAGLHELEGRERGREERGLADRRVRGRVDAGGVYITFQFGSVRPSCGENHSPGSSACPEMGKLANFPASSGAEREKHSSSSISLSSLIFLLSCIFSSSSFSSPSQIFFRFQGR